MLVSKKERRQEAAQKGGRKKKANLANKYGATFLPVLLLGCCEFLLCVIDGVVECVEREVDLGLGDDERRADADDALPGRDEHQTPRRRRAHHIRDRHVQLQTNQQTNAANVDHANWGSRTGREHTTNRAIE